MKKFTHTLLSAACILATAFTSHAQSEPKIVVVDIEKIFKAHYATVAEEAKLKAQGSQAQKDLDGLIKQRSDLIDQYKALDEQVKNPMTTSDAKSKAQSDEQSKAQEIQNKTQEMQQFAQQARQTLQQQFVNFRTQLLDDITKVVLQVAHDHGATLVLNSGAHFNEGTSPVLYADPSYDITSEVMAIIDKNKPADMPADASAPSAAAPSSAEAAPHFSVPNVTPSSQ